MFEKLYVYIAIVVSLCACSKEALRDAQECVQQADSMRAEGRMYGDSIQLAKSYKTLKLWRTIYPEEYARCCYHYGRLLRAQDDPVSAMQVFICASHVRTREYKILGRVYSNMGDLAHLAGEYSLAYDMYEHSAEKYIRDGDTLLYFYDLNNMAFERAENGRKEEALSLLSTIKNQCNDAEVLTKTLETQAVAYLYAQQYDSAIFYAKELYLEGNNEPTGLIVTAQSYSFLGQKDSSVYYATKVLDCSQDLFHLNNALYILTNDDESKDKESIRQTAADRADSQKLLEIRQGKLAQAVQLLEQDLSRHPDLTWIYAIIITLMIVGIGVCIYVFRKSKNHELMFQKLNDLRQATSMIEIKHDMLISSYQTRQKHIEDELVHKCALLRSNENILKELAWTDFEEMCRIIDVHFNLLTSKLRSRQLLNETEVRLCVLVLLDMSRADISDKLPYAPNSVGKLKDHTAKLLGTTGKNLRKFLLWLAIEG